MSVPPSTTSGFFLAGIWLGLSASLVAVSRKWESLIDGRLLLVTVGSMLLAGGLLLTFSALRWGFLGLVLGWDTRIYWRGLPIIGIELLGVFAVLHVLNTSGSQT